MIFENRSSEEHLDTIGDLKAWWIERTFLADLLANASDQGNAIGRSEDGRSTIYVIMPFARLAPIGLLPHGGRPRCSGSQRYGARRAIRSYYNPIFTDNAIEVERRVQTPSTVQGSGKGHIAAEYS
jgi:hypothetical protein